MSSPITIVIPVYNRAHTLPRTLLSIQKQTVQPAKLVLVDNGSTDTSMQVMTDWADTHPDTIIVSEQKPGAAAARNRGLREVDTEFVMFFDSDDVMTPTHVEDFTKAIEEHQDTDVFGRTIFTEFPNDFRKRDFFTATRPLFNHIFRGCLSTQRIVVRTSLVRAVGNWNEELPVWNDFELGVRLLLRARKVHNLGGAPTVIAYHQDVSITGSDFYSKHGDWEKSLSAIRKTLEEAGREDMMKWVDTRYMILAAHYELEARNQKDKDRAKEIHSAAANLMKRILESSPYPSRMKLLYLHNLYFRRLTWLLARMLFPL